MSTTSNEQVKDAAEALVAVLKAVGGKVESVNNEQQQSFNDVVKTLKKSVDTLNETMQTSNTTMDERLETANKNMEAMKDEVVEVVEAVRESNDKVNSTINELTSILGSIDVQLQKQTKHKWLQYLATLDSKLLDKICSPIQFSFRRVQHDGYHSINIFSITHKIILKFLCGLPYDIPQDYDCLNEYYNNERTIKITEESRALFRTNLKTFLDQLLDHNTRLVHKGEGNYTISYE